jgi:hypothetical protein
MPALFMSPTGRMVMLLTRQMILGMEKLMTIRCKFILACAAGSLAAISIPSVAHPGGEDHIHVMKKPFAGRYNNYWYDYKSDVDEAENELRKDLRRAKTAQDKREAWAEYNNELKDARHDYAKEMVELGYIRPGRVTVGG